MARGHWLIKSEPSTYSIDDLERDGVTEWWGVRNARARNYMRDEMAPGDPVLFYHSSTDVIGVYGLAEVASPAHPETKQFERRHPYHDPGSDRDEPRWWCVDIRHVRTFPGPVTREAMKTTPGLQDMKVLARGMRLSVLPVTPEEYAIISRLGG